MSDLLSPTTACVVQAATVQDTVTVGRRGSDAHKSDGLRIQSGTSCEAGRAQTRLCSVYSRSDTFHWDSCHVQDTFQELKDQRKSSCFIGPVISTQTATLKGVVLSNHIITGAMGRVAASPAGRTQWKTVLL